MERSSKKLSFNFSGANDIVVIEQRNGTLLSTPIRVRFRKITRSNKTTTSTLWEQQQPIVIKVNGCELEEVRMHLTEGEPIFKTTSYAAEDKSSTQAFTFPNSIKYSKENECIEFNCEHSSIDKAEFLKMINLNPGMNEISFKSSSSGQEVQAFVYKWKYDDKIIISDIDGTITKSDIRGMITTIFGKDWYHEHVTSVFDLINKNGYKIVYLSARSFYMSDLTRSLLKDLCQNECFMPRGPVLLNPVNVYNALQTEVIAKNPEEFKTTCLMNLKSLFPETSPFYAGFGNKQTDTTTYLNIGLDRRLIFIINQCGEINVDSVAEHQNNGIVTTHEQCRNLSYLKLSQLVNQYFPLLIE